MATLFLLLTLAATTGPCRAAFGALAAFWQLYWPLQRLEARASTRRWWRELFVRDAKSELLAATLCAGCLLPVWAAAACHLHLAQPPWRGPTLVALFAFGLRQLVVVALPEELFWRGELQRSLCSGEARPSWGVLCAASLAFGCAHAIGQRHLLALGTFWPGLWFAGLARRKGRLLAAVLCHAACNTLSFAMAAHAPG